MTRKKKTEPSRPGFRTKSWKDYIAGVPQIPPQVHSSLALGVEPSEEEQKRSEKVVLAAARELRRRAEPHVMAILEQEGL